MPAPSRRDGLLPRHAYLRRQRRFGLIAAAIVTASLALGVLGFHLCDGEAWLDSLVNASMLLGGMGPVTLPHSTAGKLFASFYALFAGLVILLSAGVLAAPAVHRVMHRFHLEGRALDGKRRRR